MIAYSIFNIAKMDINNTATARIDEGEFNNSIITFKNIKLVEEHEQITYELEISYLKYNDTEIYGQTLYDGIGQAASDRLLLIVSDIFNNMLELFKGDIKYDE